MKDWQIEFDEKFWNSPKSKGIRTYWSGRNDTHVANTDEIKDFIDNLLTTRDAAVRDKVESMNLPMNDMKNFLVIAGILVASAFVLVSGMAVADALFGHVFDGFCENYGRKATHHLFTPTTCE